jgi:serine/threonine protein kinase
LSIVAYQALTGRPPFVAASSVEILVQHLNRPAPALAPRCPDAPYGLVELVERMLAKNYSERPSAAEVWSSLAKLRTLRQTPPYLRIPIEAVNGVPPPMFETVLTPTTNLVHSARSDSED